MSIKQDEEVTLNAFDTFLYWVIWFPIKAVIVLSMAWGIVMMAWAVAPSYVMCVTAEQQCETAKIFIDSFAVFAMPLTLLQ